MNFSSVSQEVFLTNLKKWEEALIKGHLINDKLEVVEKNIKWRIYQVIGGLLSVFYFFVDKDAFTHLRVYNVTDGFFEYFKKNKSYLNDEIIAGFNDRILTLLENKTRSKYKILERKQFENLLPPPKIIWPNIDPRLDIEEDQKTAIASVFSEILPIFMGEDADNYTLNCFKKDQNSGIRQYKIKLKNNSSHEVRKFDVPFRIFVENNNQRRATRIFLLTKKIVGRGGERKVKACFELMSGKVCVYKNWHNPIEKLVLNHFFKKTTEGIEPIECEIKFMPKIIEPYFSNTLDNLDYTKLSMYDTFSIMHQLTVGLEALHDFSPIETSMFMETTTYPKTFHQDIKPENILARKHPSSGQWEAVLADFGIAGIFHPKLGTMGYSSPEHVKARVNYEEELKKSSDEKLDDAKRDEIFHHMLPYSQKKDVWALGLVFVTILTGEIWSLVYNKLDDKQHVIEKILIKIAPLKSLEAALKKSNDESFFDRYFTDLTQAELDRDIKYYCDKAPDEYKPLWDLVSRMLQVDFNQRATAKDVRLMLEAAIPEFQFLPEFARICFGIL